MVIDGETRVLESQSNEELVERLDQVLRQHDPDIVLTQWGDSFIIPQLLRLAHLTHRDIAFHRDPPAFQRQRRESSYFSYGKIIHKPAAHHFFGRWHIDSRNCFLWHECRWEGLFEVARVTKLPVQELSRVSVGTGITSMQLNVAHEDKVLIPWRKREPEAFKSAIDLINSDKGGLVYQPVPGFHENVAEIDFASMYPALMVSYNISPETVGCSCCPQNRLPEIGYTVCTRREGLVPKTLRPLLDKRAEYKRMKKSATDPEDAEKYQARQTALKWLLVVCFG
jgi:DNA polymerase elongation subunit (family B)